jgi:predicted lipoprotein with Yx(FWY)xxD motif
MQYRFRSPAPLLAAACALALAACGGTVASNSNGAAGSPSGAPLIHTQSMTVGSSTMTVLKNAGGLTLYYFTADTAATVACTGACATLWPPLLSSSDTTISNPSLPGRLTVLNGANGKQVVYNGHPLYNFSKDSGSSDANGQGYAGKWFVATPDLAAAAAPSASASQSGYTQGY